VFTEYLALTHQLNGQRKLLNARLQHFYHSSNTGIIKVTNSKENEGRNIHRKFYNENKKGREHSGDLGIGALKHHVIQINGADSEEHSIIGSREHGINFSFHTEGGTLFGMC
jgi:hypothetical protein